eukprot:m.194564 g.194564  ORF g.194564 m.194564 type:complete len:1277 (+) comp10619_c5_seq5:558-4388(+)
MRAFGSPANKKKDGKNRHRRASISVRLDPEEVLAATAQSPPVSRPSAVKGLVARLESRPAGSPRGPRARAPLRRDSLAEAPSVRERAASFSRPIVPSSVGSAPAAKSVFAKQAGVQRLAIQRRVQMSPGGQTVRVFRRTSAQSKLSLGGQAASGNTALATTAPTAPKASLFDTPSVVASASSPIMASPQPLRRPTATKPQPSLAMSGAPLALGSPVNAARLRSPDIGSFQAALPNSPLSLYSSAASSSTAPKSPTPWELLCRKQSLESERASISSASSGNLSSPRNSFESSQSSAAESELDRLSFASCLTSRPSFSLSPSSSPVSTAAETAASTVPEENCALVTPIPLARKSSPSLPANAVRVLPHVAATSLVQTPSPLRAETRPAAAVTAAVPQLSKPAAVTTDSATSVSPTVQTTEWRGSHAGLFTRAGLLDSPVFVEAVTPILRASHDVLQQSPATAAFMASPAFEPTPRRRSSIDSFTSAQDLASTGIEIHSPASAGSASASSSANGTPTTHMERENRRLEQQIAELERQLLLKNLGGGAKFSAGNTTADKNAAAMNATASSPLAACSAPGTPQTPAERLLPKRLAAVNAAAMLDCSSTSLESSPLSNRMSSSSSEYVPSEGSFLASSASSVCSSPSPSTELSASSLLGTSTLAASPVSAPSQAESLCATTELKTGDNEQTGDNTLNSSTLSAELNEHYLLGSPSLDDETDYDEAELLGESGSEAEDSTAEDDESYVASLIDESHASSSGNDDPAESSLLSQASSVVALSEPDEALYCSICDQTFVSVRNKEKHLLTKKHAKALEKLGLVAPDSPESSADEGQAHDEEPIGQQSDGEADNEFDVEAILEDRLENGTRFFLVKWLDCPEEESSWISEENMLCVDLIAEYDRVCLEKLLESDESDEEVEAEEPVESLVQDFVQLALDDESATPLQTLYSICQQKKACTFAAAFGGRDSLRRTVKIGEGTFAEVFCSRNDDEFVAYKVMPIEGDLEVNGEKQKTAEELVPEVLATQLLSQLAMGEQNACCGFINVNSISVCRGKYPKRLLDVWDEWNVDDRSENERPDIFAKDQLFVVFAFSNGGQDLENFNVDAWEQARSIATQVCVSLAVAEEAIAFEHRDLHWGNVLIKATPDQRRTAVLGGRKLEYACNGLETNIIDFTLSRFSLGGKSYFLDLEPDEWLFEGEGDLQFDVYRDMRVACERQWSSFCPSTNVLWMHYIADKLLREKGLKASSTEEKKARNELKSFLARARDYESARAMLSDDYFASSVCWC